MCGSAFCNQMPPPAAPRVLACGTYTDHGCHGTVTHIHVGAAVKNGPVIIPLTKGASGDWTVPAGARLNAEQMKSFKAGELYVNVHSDSN